MTFNPLENHNNERTAEYFFLRLTNKQIIKIIGSLKKCILRSACVTILCLWVDFGGIKVFSRQQNKKSKCFLRVTHIIIDTPTFSPWLFNYFTLKISNIIICYELRINFVRLILCFVDESWTVILLGLANYSINIIIYCTHFSIFFPLVATIIFS